MELFSTINIFCSLVILFVGIYSLIFHHNRISYVFGGLTFAIAIYVFGYGMELRGDSVSELNFWYHFQYFGIPFIAPFWLALSIVFTKNKHLDRTWMYSVMLVFAILFIALVQTNSLHSGHYSTYEAIEYEGVLIAQFTKEWVYQTHLVYQNLLLLTGTLLFFNYISRNTGEIKRRAQIMFLGAVFPWAAHIIYLLGASEVGIDLAPIAFTFSAPIFLWGISRYRLLNFDRITLDNVFESVPVAIVILDTNGNIRRINPMGLDVCDCSTASALGSHFSEVFEAHPHLCSTVLAHKEVSQGLWLNYPMGRKYFMVSTSPISDGSSQMGLLVLMHDITDLKEAEVTIRENERQLKAVMATKTKLFSLIAHDLKSPLGSMLTLSSLVRDNIERGRTDRALTISDHFYKGTQQVFDLLSNLLSWSKSQQEGVEPKLIPTHLLGLINETILLMKHITAEKGIKINTPIVDLQAPVDREMFSTVIRNLISNSIKFSNRDSTIDVRMQILNYEVQVSVCDQGVGIPENELENIFDPEMRESTHGTNEEKGSGLGLMICREFVEILGGRIWVESRVGEGTTFHFTVPRASKSAVNISGRSGSILYN